MSIINSGHFCLVLGLLNLLSTSQGVLNSGSGSSRHDHMSAVAADSGIPQPSSDYMANVHPFPAVPIDSGIIEATGNSDGRREKPLPPPTTFQQQPNYHFNPHSIPHFVMQTTPPTRPVTSPFSEGRPAVSPQGGHLILEGDATLSRGRAGSPRRLDNFPTLLNQPGMDYLDAISRRTVGPNPYVTIATEPRTAEMPPLAPDSRFVPPVLSTTAITTTTTAQDIITLRAAISQSTEADGNVRSFSESAPDVDATDYFDKDSENPEPYIGTVFSLSEDFTDAHLAMEISVSDNVTDGSVAAASERPVADTFNTNAILNAPSNDQALLTTSSTTETSLVSEYTPAEDNFVGATTSTTTTSTTTTAPTTTTTKTTTNTIATTTEEILLPINSHIENVTHLTVIMNETKPMSTIEPITITTTTASTTTQPTTTTKISTTSAATPPITSSETTTTKTTAAPTTEVMHIASTDASKRSVNVTDMPSFTVPIATTDEITTSKGTSTTTRATTTPQATATSTPPPVAAVVPRRKPTAITVNATAKPQSSTTHRPQSSTTEIPTTTTTSTAKTSTVSPTTTTTLFSTTKATLRRRLPSFRPTSPRPTIRRRIERPPSSTPTTFTTQPIIAAAATTTTTVHAVFEFPRMSSPEEHPTDDTTPTFQLLTDPPTTRRQYVITVPPLIDTVGDKAEEGNGDVGVEATQLTAPTEEGQGGIIPEGATNAIIVSSIIGGCAILFFAIVMVFCMWRQHRSRRPIYPPTESSNSSSSSSTYHGKMG